MNSERILHNISCGRCHSKKIRCNRVIPRCDQCETAGSECVYSPRKARPQKQKNEFSDRDLLLDALGRLSRLEEHCCQDGSLEFHRNAVDNSSFFDLGAASGESIGEDSTPEVPFVIQNAIHNIENQETRSLLLSNVFCHVRLVNACFFDNERCIKAINSATAEIEALQKVQEIELPRGPIVPKDLAKNLIEKYYGCHQFEGFKYPLEKEFLASIPDLIENPHVELDYTSQIIFNSVLLQGILSDPGDHPNRGITVRKLQQKCFVLTTEWTKNIQNNPVDFLAASLIMSIGLEGCHVDIAWRAFSHSCRISKALGYFSVDDALDEQDDQIPIPDSPPEQEIEVERNRKRFGFWHILRTDCLFRMSFGKPTLIPAGSWKVNFPDPTITGVDDKSSHYIQIHFFASMRLAMVVMRYLDWIEGDPKLDPVSHDAIIESYIEEVQSILLDWDTEGLLQMATDRTDIWLCVDVLFSSYKMLIVLYQSKKCDQGPVLPYKSVDLARKFVQIFQSLMGSSQTFSGISLILLHQFLPFFILCLNILGNPDHQNLNLDLASVIWLCDYVERIVKERIELKPVLIIMKSMASACQQVQTEFHTQTNTHLL